MSKLALACELSLNDWLVTFPDVIPKAEHTKNHEKWKRNLFNKMRDDHYHRFTTKTIRIMFVAAILLAFLLTAFVIPSSREFILDEFGKYSTYQISEHNDNYVTGEIKVDYIPDGFEFDNTEYYSKGVLFEYKSSNRDFFNILKCSSSMKMEFNTEFSDSEEIIVNNIKYVYCQGNEGVNNLLWSKNDYVYRIEGVLTKEEMLKIAKNAE